MCSRYYVELSPELRPIIEAARHSSLAGKMVHDLGRPVVSEGEVRPTDIAPVLASNSRGTPSVFPMIWGFRQADRENTKRSQPLINARSETADVKPTFRECWQRRRCVVPASYYFEWQHLAALANVDPAAAPAVHMPADAFRMPETHASRTAESNALRAADTKKAARETSRTADKFAIQPAGETVTWLAGLYRIENGYPFFTILTREPSAELAKIHDRMPLILPKNLTEEWISPGTSPERVKQIAASALTDMVFERV